MSWCTACLKQGVVLATREEAVRFVAAALGVLS
jgi:hypothetical protein